MGTITHSNDPWPGAATGRKMRRLGVSVQQIVSFWRRAIAGCEKEKDEDLY